MTVVEIVALIGAGVSLLTLFGVGKIVSDFLDEKKERRKENSAEAKQAQKAERMEAVREVVQAELKPLHAEIENIGKDVKELQESDKTQKESLQSILRDRLYELNSTCFHKGFATLDERENFENMYQKYHNLGMNGVMDDIHTKFFKLPIEKKED